MTKISRAVWFLIALAIDLGLIRELMKRPAQELEAMMYNIMSRESLLFIAIIIFSGLTIIAAWPVIVLITSIPNRYAERRAKRIEREREQAIRLLNGCASILRGDWAVIRGKYHPGQPYRLAEVLDAFLERHVTYPDRLGMQRATRTRLDSYLCKLKAKGLVPASCPDGPCRVWADDFEHLSAVLQTNGMKAARRHAVKFQGDSPEDKMYREKEQAVPLLECVRDEIANLGPSYALHYENSHSSLSDAAVSAQEKLTAMGLGAREGASLGEWVTHAEEVLEILRLHDGVNRARSHIAGRSSDRR